ncbi:MAG TPA: hypothetical protein VF407_25310 [Polyangiaceae bacterium]
MKTIALASLFLAPFVFGCSSSSSNDSSFHSSNIATSEMVPSFSVQSGDSNVKVFAALFKKNDDNDNSSLVTLDDGDSFVATPDGGTPVTLTHGPNDDDAHYSATLPLATAAENITIAFVRGNGQVSAPNTVVPLAAPFAMTSTSPDTVKKGDMIPFTLAPVPSLKSSDIQFEIFGPCVDDSDTTLPTPVVDVDGNGSFDTNKLPLKGSTTCQVQLYVDALTTGTTDAAFKGGSANAVPCEQRRAITRTITP